MKKSVLLLLLCFVSIGAYAQYLTQQMCFLPSGNVKKVESWNASANLCAETVYFDRKGKIAKMVFPNGEYTFEWNADNTEIECSLVNNGEVVQKDYIYVNEMDSEHYDYDINNVNNVLKLRPNNTIASVVATSNGQTMTNKAYYKGDNDILPYKTVMSMGDNRQVIFYRLISTDSHDNPIRYSMSSGGTTVEIVRKITYY